MPSTDLTSSLSATAANPFDASRSIVPVDPLNPPLSQSTGLGRSSATESSVEEPFGLIRFTSGYFTVGSTGQVSIDYLFDGGGYEGEVAIFSLEGIEQFAPGTPDFIREVARRALSDTTEGHVVIRDRTDAARFSGELGAGDSNTGNYLGVQTFTMKVGDRFGVVLVPEGRVNDVWQNPSIAGSQRPLFSLVDANPNFGFHLGQIADVDGKGSTFVLEDLRVDGESDRDYNDIIFQVRGAIGSAISLDEVIPFNTDWRELALGQALLEYAAAYDNPRLPQPIRYDFPPANQPLIGIIDTGFSGNNPDLDYSRITLGRDRVDNDADPLLAAGTGNEHGTHILGIIGATQDNGIGIDGINDQAPLWVGRAIGSGKWAESLTEFVDRARRDEQPNAVVNLSLDLTQKNPDGSTSTRYEFTPEERKAIEYARQNGVILVVAAGNDGGVMSALGQASQEFDNIITVGAAIGNDRAFYSSYGAGLDILAPGGTKDAPVYSTVGDGLGAMAGTSVATAEVTGAISQVWAANPGLSYRQAIEILKATATDLQEPGWDAATGAGLLNLERAVELALQTPPETYQPTGWIAPTTWQGQGTLPPEERAAKGGVSRDQAFFMAAAFSDSDTLSAAVPKRYYKVYVDKPGYYEWTVTRTNGTATVPPAGLVDGNGKRARHRFIPGSGAFGSVTASVSGGSVPTSVTSGEFVDAGIYYLEVGGSVGSAASYTLDTKWIPDKATIATAGNAVFNPQVRISNQQDQYQPFATGTTNSLNASGTVTYKFGDDGKQYANYSFEVSEPGQLSFNLNSPNGRTGVNVKKFVGQSNQAVTIGGGEFSPTSTGSSVLNLNPGRYEVEVMAPHNLHTDPDGRVILQNSLAQDDQSLFVVNRPYTLNATFARTAPKPGEGKVPSNAGVLTETVSSNGVTTHYYANGYLTIQPSGVATWYSKGLWATVTPIVDPTGQNPPTTTLPSFVAPPPIPTPTPIFDPDGDETMAKARSLIGAQSSISTTITPLNPDGSEQASTHQQGVTQQLNNSKEGQIGGGSDLNDWYKVKVGATGIYEFTLDGLGTSANLNLWNDVNGNKQPEVSSGELEDSVSTGTKVSSIKRILSPGDYYIQITPSNGAASQPSNYKLYYSIQRSLLDGNYLRDRSSGGIYVIENGSRLSIEPAIFRAMGLTLSNTTVYSHEDIKKIPFGGEYKPIWQQQIESKYGSTRGMLGNKFGSIEATGGSANGTTGYFQRYATGSIYWSAKYDAVAVWHDIQRVYEQNGGTGGKLGFPTQEEQAWEGGKRTSFEGGYIFFTDRLKAQVYYNGETPWQKEIESVNKGMLGNATGLIDRAGQSEKGTTGYFQNFQHGTIHWSAEYGAVPVWYAIQDEYARQGGSSKWLGFPTQQEHDWEGVQRTDFEGGFIIWNGQQAKAYHTGETPDLTPPTTGSGGSSGSVKPETLALIEKYDRVYSNNPVQPGHTGAVYTGSNYIDLKNSPEFAEMWNSLLQTNAPVDSDGGYLDHYAFIAPGSVHNNTYHAGIDFSVPFGTPVKALVGGEVVYVGTYYGDKTSPSNPMASWEWGTIAVYNAELKQTFMYLHMDTSNFSQGDTIQPGQVIGLSGSTGVPSPHLHLEVKPTPSKPAGNDVKGLLAQDRKDWQTIQDLTDNPLTAFLVARDKGLTADGNRFVEPPSSSSDEYQVDWNFIGQLEGGARTEGYVPWWPGARNNVSGVTVATGFDLGQKNENGLQNMGLSSELIEKLVPYLGKKQQDAVDFLNQHPLSLSSEEVFEIDKKSKSQALRALEERYNSVSPVRFKDLPSQAQTTIASVAFQYGTYFGGEFWAYVSQQKWREAVQDLRTNFFDGYENRRNTEANLLEQIV